jgi:hypothetical protein
VQLAAARLAGLGAQRGQALEVGRLRGRGALAGRLEHGLGGGVALAGRSGVGDRGAEHRLPAAQLRVAGLGGGDLLVGADERGGRAHPRALGLGAQVGPQALHVGHLLSLARGDLAVVVVGPPDRGVRLGGPLAALGVQRGDLRVELGVDRLGGGRLQGRARQDRRGLVERVRLRLGLGLRLRLRFGFGLVAIG